MHFEAYQAHPERIHVVAACDVDAERVQQAQQAYGFRQGFGSLQEMIVGAEWDVAVVCTPTPVRTQVVAALARAGKHVFVEKPFADSYGDAQQMVNLCRQAGVGLAVNQNFRYHYPFEMAREVIARGEIGGVVSVVHEDMMKRQDSGWRTQTRRHALAVMGIHWLDGFRRLLQDEAASLICATRSSTAIDCMGETDVAIQLQFAQGTLVSYVESFASPVSRTETLVLGECGGLSLTYDHMRVFDLHAPGTVSRQVENPLRGAYKPEATFLGLDALLQALEQGSTEPVNSGNDNLKTMALLDGAYRSAEEQRIVYFGNA